MAYSDTRPVPGFPGYRVTRGGAVLSKSTGRPLRPRPHGRSGHLRVRLYVRSAPLRAAGGSNRNGATRRARFVDVYVHVAVCLAFHGPPPFEGAFVLHYNDDPTDNAPDNLRWGSRADNAADYKRNTTPVDDDGFDWRIGEWQTTSPTRAPSPTTSSPQPCTYSPG